MLKGVLVKVVLLIFINIHTLNASFCSARCQQGWGGITFTSLCNDNTATTCTSCDPTFFDLNGTECDVNTTRYYLEESLLQTSTQYDLWTKTTGTGYQTLVVGLQSYNVATLFATSNISYTMTISHNHSSLRFRMFLWIADAASGNNPGEMTIVVNGINSSYTFNNTYVKYLDQTLDYYIYTTPDIPHNGTTAIITLFLKAPSTGSFNVGIKQLMVFSKPCPAHCLDCYTKDSVVHCSVCITNYYEYNGRCYYECPNATYLFNGTTCYPCHATCGTCNSSASTTCNSCSRILSAYRYLSNGSCLKQCPENTYPTLENFICASCADGCQNCTGPEPENCTACGIHNSAAYYLDASGKGCRLTCPSGQVYLSYLGQNKCTSCISSCATCSNSPVNCTSCVWNQTGAKYFFKWNNSCVHVCPPNFTDITGECTCGSGYWLTQSYSCLACDRSCSLCFGSGNNKCTSCNNGYYYISNQTTCRSRCPTGQFNYLASSDCKACSTNCLSCSNTPTSCLSCNTSTYLFNSTCVSVCPTGYGGVKYPNICKQCINGTSSYNNTCVSNCPPLYKVDNSTNSCILFQYEDKQLFDFSIFVTFVNKGTQLCITLFFKTKLMVIHDIDDKIQITLSTATAGRLLQGTSQDLNISNVDIDQSLLNLKIFTNVPESMTDTANLNNSQIIITFFNSTLKSENGVLMNQYKSYPLSNPSFLRQIYTNFYETGLDAIGIVFSVIGILLLPLAYFKKSTYYPILQFLMQLQLMRLLSFTLYPVSYNTFAFLRGFDVSQFQWMPNVVDLSTPAMYTQNSFLIYQFKSSTMNFLSLSASNLLLMLIFQPVFGYMYLYDKQQFGKFILWAEKTLIYICSINILFAAFSSFISLFINTQNLSLLFIISQLLGLLAIGLLVFFFILQRKNFTRYKMFLITSFAFCILVPFFSKSFPISLVLLNIAQIVIIVASYKNRKKSDKRTKPLLIGRCLFLIMIDVVELASYPAVVITIGTLYFVGQLAILAYIIYRSYVKKDVKKSHKIEDAKTISVKDQIKQQPILENEQSQNVVQFSEEKPEELMYYDDRSERSPRKKIEEPRANLRKDSQTYYSPRKNWRNYNTNKSRTIYKDEESVKDEKDKEKSPPSDMHLSIKPLNDPYED